MRPLGVTLIAILHWLRGAAYVAVGLALLGITHLSAHMISSVAADTFFQRLVSGLGKTLGYSVLLFALLYIVMGVGMWAMKNWARVLTLIFAVIWLASATLRLMQVPSAFHLLRAAVDVAILVYLLLPDVKRVFVS
jgi:uncharacterized membrane protein (DUF2068 family)